MLTEEALSALPAVIVARLEKLNADVIKTICERIKAIGEMSVTDVHNLNRTQQYAADMAKITREIETITALNVSEIKKIYDVVADDATKNTKKFFEETGKAEKYLPYEENEPLKQWVKALSKQTNDTYVNMSKNTAFLMKDENGEAVLTSVAKTYQNVVDDAITAVTTGVSDYNSEMRKIITQMADSGVRTVDYASGYHRRLDTAVRQNVLWGVKQCNDGISEQIGEEFGADGYEISYHRNPRPSHVEMAGHHFVIGKGREIEGKFYKSFEEFAEPFLNEYNCLHRKFPIICGVSPQSNSDEELEALKAKDRETIEYEGKKYTGYEASQMQRKLEAKIRNAKDRQMAAKAAGDMETVGNEQAKINVLNKQYKRFSDTAGLSYKAKRLKVDGYTRAKKSELLTEGKKSGIIKEKSDKNITVITDISIKSVPNVKIDGYTDEECLFIQQQHKELLTYARDKNDNNEVAFVFRKGLTNRREYLGDDDSIEFYNALYGKGDELFVMHNHPRNSSYSTTDIILFKNNDTIKSLSIVKNDGGIEILTKGKNFDSETFKLEYDRLRAKLVKNDTSEEKTKFVKTLITKTRAGVIWNEQK